jgi:hypothetical protein
MEDISEQMLNDGVKVLGSIFKGMFFLAAISVWFVHYMMGN